MKKYKVISNSITYEFHSEKRYSVLSLCNRNRVVVPHSCFEGRCGLCKARLIEGMVEETITVGLSQELRREKYILTCQSKCTSDSIQINFDKD